MKNGAVIHQSRVRKIRHGVAYLLGFSVFATSALGRIVYPLPPPRAEQTLAQTSTFALVRRQYGFPVPSACLRRLPVVLYIDFSKPVFIIGHNRTEPSVHGNDIVSCHKTTAYELSPNIKSPYWSSHRKLHTNATVEFRENINDLT